MNNTELYINGKLVDTGGDLGVRLNRKLIDPGALNTVDAQYSYSISLPPTQRNNEAFNYALVEETKNKFNRVYNAQLIVNGVRIFGPGLFRLTSVQDGFKGQLYLPAKKTIKDIFGDKKLNQNAPYLLPFLDFAEYVSLYNNAAANAPQPAIFPYVLYGVLPKVPLNSGGAYSPRNVWDDTVQIGIQDLPPAVNSLLMLKHIFNSAGYALQGTALQDTKLLQLYQSYKNAQDYVQPWNYGHNAAIHISGSWSNHTNTRTGAEQYERKCFNTADYITDLLDCNNGELIVISDPGGNVTRRIITDDDGRQSLDAQIYIPASGYYKLEFNSSLHVDNGNDLPQSENGINFISGGGNLIHAQFDNTIFELRVSRDNKQGDFGLFSAHTDGTFYRDNQPQNNTFDSANMPKYFPQVTDDGQINFIDKAQDANVVTGCMFGQTEYFINPKDTANKWAQAYVAKPSLSWNPSDNTTALTKLAVNSLPWWYYDNGPSGLTSDISDKYEIVLNNAPTTYAKRGMYAGSVADDINNAQASVNIIVWLEAGELLTIAAVSSTGNWATFGLSSSGYVKQNCLYDLKITPFRTDSSWLKVNSAGQGTAPMDWDDESNFASDTIDLVGFLDADVKTDDYIDNFCKMFNLGLSQIDPQTFSLDAKQSKTATSNVFVDLDALASVKQRENTPLGLPSQYILGFTIDNEEEGYVETGEDGGGTYKTGATEENIVTQTTSFSYNWYKAITKVEPGGDIVINLPIISKSEAWDPAVSYPDAMQKRYTDLAQRFMYYGGILPGTYAYNGASLDIANVRNDLPGASVLNYKNDLYTILTNYFTLLISGASHYTNIKGFITAVIYGLLDGSRTVRFNGDIYYIAEISAYDPYNRNQTTIKLIRKI